nr:hypothetical protein CFP56_70575 [Quercus suber]
MISTRSGSLARLSVDIVGFTTTRGKITGLLSPSGAFLIDKLITTAFWRDTNRIAHNTVSSILLLPSVARRSQVITMCCVVNVFLRETLVALCRLYRITGKEQPGASYKSVPSGRIITVELQYVTNDRPVGLRSTMLSDWDEL